jgi:mannose-6-phosphate isomerase-like protein (cupin superfamily)
MKSKRLQFTKGFRIAISNPRCQGAEMVLATGAVEGGPDNRHRYSDQWLYVVDGAGEAIVNRRRYVLEPGTLLLIERGDSHEIRNPGRGLLRTLNFYVPPEYGREGNSK